MRTAKTIIINLAAGSVILLAFVLCVGPLCLGGVN